MARTAIASTMSSAYRSDIDGLRAIAVSAVVLFHAGADVLAGGYVGVDVFFVISGYLITRQVLTSAEQRSFSFGEFYVRRVRRLLPAALTTIAATLLFAIFVLPPFRIVEIARSAAAAAASISNIYFWQTSGYWAEASANQPLLHTWSLSVEEQFYLAWPVLILLLARRRRLTALIVVITLAVISIAVTTYATGAAPDAAFYLTPFRLYEFAAGALCVWIERFRRSAERGQTLDGALWLAGIGMILFSVLAFEESGTAFPGWVAVIPAAGTAFVILSRRPRGFDTVLSNKLMRYVGLRSYSLYLVHWPIIVFTVELTGSLTITSGSFCIVLTVILAEAQYRWVERPLRIRASRPSRMSWRAMSRRFSVTAGPVLAVAALVISGALGTSVAAASPAAYAEEVRPIVEMDRDALNAQRRLETNALCDNRERAICGTASDDQQNILIVGDSIGPEGYLFARELAPDANFLTAERAACPPLLDLDSIDGVDDSCRNYNASRIADIERTAPHVDVIVLAMRLQPERADSIDALITWLGELGTEVVVLGMGAHYDQAAWQTIVAAGSLAQADRALFSHLDVDASDNALFERITTDAGAVYASRWDWMCGADACRAMLSNDPTDLVMVDTAHMTREAAIAWARTVIDDPTIQSAFANGRS